MYYKILKSGFDGISGGESRYESIDEVLREVRYHKGWDTLEQLHAAIRKWSENADPGSVFTTQVTAIVAVGLSRGEIAGDCCTECWHEALDYGELNPVEDGDIEQEVECPNCGRRWMDVFAFSERRPLSPRSRDRKRV